jgi:hypothetical protein
MLRVAVFVALAIAFSSSFGAAVRGVQAADNIALQWYELQDRVLFAPLGSGPVRGPNRVLHTITITIFSSLRSSFRSPDIFIFSFVTN